MTTTAVPASRLSATSAPASGGKYLTFMLGREEYGLPVMKVREIIKVMDITHVPQVAAHVLGVINLRGKVIPVIDLRRKFGLPAQEHTERTCIIVAEVDLLRDNVPDHAVVKQRRLVRGPGCDDVPELPGGRRGARRPCRAHSGVR